MNACVNMHMKMFLGVGQSNTDLHQQEMIEIKRTFYIFTLEVLEPGGLNQTCPLK